MPTNLTLDFQLLKMLKSFLAHGPHKIRWHPGSAGHSSIKLVDTVYILAYVIILNMVVNIA